MTIRKRAVAVTTTLVTALAMPAFIAAQGASQPSPQYQQYTLIDLGTFGGPQSFVNGPLVPIVSNRGTYGGEAETATPDPFAPNCQNDDCLVQHAQKWRNGVVSDLGTLPGANLSSGATWVSGDGTIVGQSANGLLDSLGLPQWRAVIWAANGNITDLGTLPGGLQSFAAAVNDRKQVGGWSTNDVPDAFSMTGLGFQTRSVLWQGGVALDLGTLGGPDAVLEAMNRSGQMVGISYTSSIPNDDSGIPTIEPFLWQNGVMVSLGSFGGTNGAANFINNRGQVVGSSNLAEDQTKHPFLWDRGHLIDLGTLGGDSGDAAWINEAGEVAGEADLTGSMTHDAFLWSKGAMTDLGNLGITSVAYAINLVGQVVGHSKLSDGTFHAFLWQNGGPMVDLNALVSPVSDFVVINPYIINDQGEIATTAALPNGDQHAVLLIPSGPCDDACEARIAASRSSQALARRPVTVKQEIEVFVSPITRSRNRFYHGGKLAATPSN